MKYVIACYCLLLLTDFSFAQATDTIRHKKYTLIVVNKDPSFRLSLRDSLSQTFFRVYPELAKFYNKNTAKQVTFVIDTAYKGVAATANGRVTFSSKYMMSHPNDIDVVTHEVMHIVQAYGRSVGPGWLTEGIADYARNQFGVQNAAAKWVLADYKAGQNYTNSYRITARFLVWLEKNGHKGLVREFDKQLRDHTFTDKSWAKYTHKSLDELWAMYASNFNG